MLRFKIQNPVTAAGYGTVAVVDLVVAADFGFCSLTFLAMLLLDAFLGIKHNTSEPLLLVS